MNPEIKAKRTLSFRNKLSVALLAVVFAILLISQGLLYRLVAGRIEVQARERAQTSLAAIGTYMETKVKNVIERLYYIRMDQSFSNAVEKLLLEPGSAMDGDIMSSISNTLSLYKITEPLISSLYFYTPEASYTDMTVFVTKNYSFENSKLYSLVREGYGPIIWGTPCTDEIFISHKEVVPLLYRFTIDGYSRDNVILANLDQNRIYEYLKDILYAEDASVLLFDDGGQVIASRMIDGHIDFVEKGLEPKYLSTLAGQGNGVYNEHMGGEEYWLNYQEISASPWNIVYIQSKSDALARLTSLTRSFIVINLVVILITFLAVTGVVKKITHPLYQLSVTMKNAGKENYEIGFPYYRKDEIGVLASSFNNMLQYTHELIMSLNQTIEQLQDEKEKVRIQQLLKRRAELKALQAQINPHFLYNTLDSIRWKAEEIDAEDISQMTQALATLFRIGLSRGREIIPVEDEIRHVTSYLKIQCQRYGDRLSYELKAASDLDSLYIVKLVLQPLVENAIYHGIKEKGSRGTVNITGFQENGAVVFTVEDEGVGIAEDKLAVIRKDLARNLSVSKEGYGIFNVNERIRLYFGDDYGVTIDSVYGKGTKVTIRMPIIEEKDVETYVPYSDSRR